MKKGISLLLAFSIVLLSQPFVSAQDTSSDTETDMDAFRLFDSDAAVSVSPLFSEEIENTRPFHQGLNIRGENRISEEGASVTLHAVYIQNNYLDAVVPNECVWTVDSRNVTYSANKDGSVTVTGKLNGEATIRVAAVVDGVTYEDTMPITVSGQSAGYTLSFDKNTANEVTNMPEALCAKGKESFPNRYPRRDAYRFVGWALTENGTVTDTVTVTKDTTVYAIWEKARHFVFDRPGDDEGFAVEGGSHIEVLNGALSFLADSKTIIRSPVLAVPADSVEALEIRMSHSAEGINMPICLTLASDAGINTYTEYLTTTADGITRCRFDLRNVKGVICGFSAACGADYGDNTAVVAIDDISFVGRSVLTYDANTSDIVEGMPENIREAPAGSVTVSTEAPTRTGYTFLCWSASPQSKLPVSGKLDVSADNPLTLYAVWDKNDHWEFDTYKNSFHPAGVSDFSFKDGIFTFDRVSGSSIDNVSTHTLGYSTDTTSKKIEMRLRWQVSRADGLKAIACVWSDKIEQYPAASEQYIDLSVYGASPEDFVTVVFDGTNFRYFDDNILEKLRFYPINMDGKCELDYIRFIGSEANILTSGTYKSQSYDVSYIVPEGSVIVPQGVAVWNELHLAGDIDFADGIAVVRNVFESADDGDYTVYTLDMDKENVTAVDTMSVDGQIVPMIDGAVYLFPKNGKITFDRLENTTGAAMTIKGGTTVFIGDGTQTFAAEVTGVAAQKRILWLVDRTDVAVVDENGVLTPIKEGKVRLTAFLADDPAVNAVVTVTVAKHVFSMTLSGEENIVNDGKTRTYTVNMSGDVPSDSSVVFSTDNPSVALIDAKTGVLSACGAGSVRITAASVYNPDVKAELSVFIRYADFSLEIIGPDTLERSDRGADYSCKVSGEYTGKMTFTWTVNDPDKAFITENGRLASKTNGEVIIRATSDYNPAVYAEKTVTLSGQTGLYKLTYHAGTQDSVTGMPEPLYDKYHVVLSDEVPEREGYAFLGWTASEESLDIITEVDLNRDTEVYALWGKGICYEFNSSLDGVTNVSNGTAKLSGDGYMIVTSYGDARLTMKGMSIDPERHKHIEIRMAVDQKSYVKAFYTAEIDHADGSVTKLGYNNDGYKDAERLSLSRPHNDAGLDNWFIQDMPMYDRFEYEKYSTENMWYHAGADRITGLWLNILGASAGTAYVDYIRILDSSRDIRFDAATSDTVTGMPKDMSAAFGSQMEIKSVPSRKGYRFLGFSKTPDDAENIVDGFFTVRDDVTFYAVWRKIYTSDDGTSINIGVIDENDGDTLLVNAPKSTAVILNINGKTLTATAGAAGYALFDISDELPANDAAVTVKGSDKVLSEAVVLPVAALQVSADSGKKVGTGSDTVSSMGFDTSVETVVSYKQYYNPNAQTEEEVILPTPDYAGITDPILINFETPIEERLFKDYRYVTSEGMSDSMLELHVKTRNDASLETVDLNIDAATHPYVVMKIRGREIPTLDVGFNFIADGMGTRYITSNTAVKTMTGDWTMLVYDLRDNPKWTDTVNTLRFTFAEPVDDILSIDWILFTDTVPDSFEEIKGYKTYFATVNSGVFPFDDVTESDWFYSRVRNIWRLGFVCGVDEKTFDPDGNVTVAQTIVLAVRIKNRLMGKEAMLPSADGEEWYVPYARQAAVYQFITEGQFDDYNAPISRKECVDILCRALPAHFFKAINYYGKVPDMSESDVGYKAVLRLYDAGILVGRNDSHEFFPDSLITRAELATLIVKMITENDRDRVITDAERERNKIVFEGKELVDVGTYFYGCASGKAVTDGTMATAKSNTADPVVFFEKLYNFDEMSIMQYSKITIGMKWDTSVVTDPVAYGCCLFFTTENETKYAEDRKIKAKWNGKTDENGIGEFIIDLSAHEKKSDIRFFRFDPFDADNCEFSIAYIIIS